MIEFPRIATSDVNALIRLIEQYQKNPDLLDDPNCPYVATMCASLRTLFEMVTPPAPVEPLPAPSIFPRKGVNPLSENINLELAELETKPMTVEQLIHVLDSGIKTLEDVMNSKEGSEASRVSATRNVFELVQKRIELVSKMGDVESVWKYSALVKEFFQRTSDRKMAEEFMSRLEELTNGKH